MKNITKSLYRLKTEGHLEPYIKYIRFPYYRNLNADLKVSFDFPLTAIVGQNGTNKSSLLRALWACPEGNSLARFWFSTDVDRILEDGGRPRYIYSYYQQEAERDVEVIKMRIQNPGNPEYWEPARPRMGDKMEKMPPIQENDKLRGRDRTRWNLIKKNALYLNFRSEISAFDKYFYHGELNQTLKTNTKQDFIRHRSKYLKEVIEFDLSSKRIFKGKHEHVYKNKVLPIEQIEAISKILDRQYSNIRIVEHRFFSSRGLTVIFMDRELNYSEAFAGSGEFSVAILVNKVFEAPTRSLILLDEPEVSLHPGAQTRILEFLQERIVRQKHQIVISTHSPFLIRGLPPEAVKTLFFDKETGKVFSTEKTDPDEAFFHLGVINSSKYKLFVEDRLAAEVVKKALRMLGQAKHERCEPVYLPGGANTLLNSYFIPFARTKRFDSLFILDGDQQKYYETSEEGAIANCSNEQLDKLLSSIFIKDVPLPVDGTNEGKNRQQEREAKIDVLKYAKTNLIYLPEETPESFIWSKMKYDISQYGEVFDEVECFKDKFRVLCRKELRRQPYESVTSDEIFELQKRCLATVEDPVLSELRDKIDRFICSQPERDLS